jgi:hypothetical protein
MNSYHIIEVLILIVRRELDIDVLTDTGGNHALLIIFNLKIWRGGR